jgi:acetyl-CoA carboxylase carboxyl transferase subunit beta
MPIFKDKEYLRVDLDKEPDESLWMKCKSCGELVFKRRVRENNNICPSCGEYFFLTAVERIALLADEASFEDMTLPIAADDPLEFSDRKPYPDRVADAQARTGLGDAILIGRASIAGFPVVIGVMDFRFIGGSMGSVVGEQICHGMEAAIEDRRPFVLVSSSGGARVQEGLFSLLQMAKTVAVRAKMAEVGLPFISVMTYPTSGGVQASIASLGDVIIAERGAMIGFAGRRVIQNAMAQELPSHFQSDAFAFEHGAIDRVVGREGMRDELSSLLGFFVEAQ